MNEITGNGNGRPPSLPSHFACPHCTSESTQKLTVIHVSGTSTIAATSRSEHLGLGPVGPNGQIGVMVGNTATRMGGVQQTIAAARAAPPVMERVGLGCLARLFLLAIFFVSMAIAGGIAAHAWGRDDGQALVGCIAGVSVACVVTRIVSELLRMLPPYTWRLRTAKERFDILAYEYERKWYCHRCGTVFVLAPVTHQVETTVS